MRKNIKSSNYIIAIDGPAASGKSTTAKALAKELEYVYIDTGAMYRACGLLAEKLGISIQDDEKLSIMMKEINIEIKYSENGNKIFLNGEDVSKAIREPHVGKLASDISARPVVRQEMTRLQRQLGKNGRVVMDGRDIGTVVFPDADYKIFMVADVKVRARRRWLEEKAKGSEKTLEQVTLELLERDYNDSNREIAPLKKADDALEVDSSYLTIEKQVEKILLIIGE